MLLGLASALAWGSGDFGGGLLSRRAPLLGVVLFSQLMGIVAALAMALVRGEPGIPPTDIAWSCVAGVFGLVGIAALYHGLAVGRMGVVAPTTGVLAALLPVVVGFASQGLPAAPVMAGIVAALVAVVLVTRTSDASSGRPSGAGWALLAGLCIGGFNTTIAQLSGVGAFGPLALIRLIQAVLLGAFILTRRQPWRLPRDLAPGILVVGLLDMAGNALFILATQAGALAVAAVLSSLYPVVTVLLAIVVLRERVTLSHLAGIALTAVAIVLIGAGDALA